MFDIQLGGAVWGAKIRGGGGIGGSGGGGGYGDIETRLGSNK